MYVYGMRYSSLQKLNNVYTDASVESFVCHCIKYSPVMLGMIIQHLTCIVVCLPVLAFITI